MVEEPKDAVSCLLLYPTGEVIIQEHAKTGMLTIPSGARELGESADEAIVRELKEELDIEVKASEFVMTELLTHPKLKGEEGYREFRYVLPVSSDFKYRNAEPEKHPWMGPMHPLNMHSINRPFTEILTSVISKMENGEYNKYMTA